MAPVLEAETQVALEQLQQAETQASVLESRLDRLDATLDALLNELSADQYGASSSDVNGVVNQGTPGRVPDQRNATVGHASGSDGPDHVDRNKEEADDEEEQAELARRVVQHLERSDAQREREREQEDKLLDMMDA